MPELIHKVLKEKEGSYYTVGFTVPENVVKITVSYDYHRETKGFMSDLHPTNTIDIGLEDAEGRFLGWSGSAHKSIYVGEFGSTRGYLSEPIMPGEWKIIVGAYHVAGDSVDVKYNIEFEYKKELLVFGDLHVHSDASDGQFDIYTLGKMAREQNLDFLAVANHNNFAENFNLPKIDGLTFIKAVEWTHYKGHINFFGAAAPFGNSFISNSFEETEKLIDDAKRLGALISVNHPKCRFCPYTWDNYDCFDMMEIWNGPMRPSNIDAIKLWTDFLKQGKRLPIVGGSDYHRPHSPAKLGNPVTAVYTQSRKDEDILTALRNGHSFVTSSADGVRLKLKYGEAVMGDETAFKPCEKLGITAENLKMTSLILVTDKYEKKLCRPSNGKIEIAEPLCSDIEFAYIKAVKGIGKASVICAITNPIYFKNNKEELN
ncbi:MAG: CehA/McbA family metallohydrolase [Clostridia bacterium]|nr:CehA/McbA family metallohydrolase [Clostridia bacterium]